MAEQSEQMSRRITQMLEGEPRGLEMRLIIERLTAEDGDLSPRAIREVLNEMAEAGQLVRVRRSAGARGAPPIVFYHPRHTAVQLALDLVPGLEGFKVETRPQIEQQDLDAEELTRQQKSASVMRQLAEAHVHGDRLAQAVINVAARLAQENPVELVLEMAQWVVGDINSLGREMQNSRVSNNLPDAEEKARELEVRIHWVKRILQRFFRLHRGVEGLQGILDLPERARRWAPDEHEARLDLDRARELLKTRIVGDHVLEVTELPDCRHTHVAGTDASVADVYVEHPQGSFIPPEPVSVMTAAAALQVRGQDKRDEYQEFDVFPDRLNEYGDTRAAVEGLVLSPSFRSILPEDDFKHSRMAAMDLRQYYEDMRIATRTANWRPMGEAPLLGVTLKPSLVVRDGRLLPLVHRLKDYEHGGLYGLIVRGEMERYASALLNLTAGPSGHTVYAATVKSPELSWLSPLVMWYMLSRGIRAGDRAIVPEDVYKAPLTDTAVSHLLFLGLAKALDGQLKGRAFRTFFMIRRFSDIAVCDDGSLPVIEEAGQVKLLDEDDEEHWKAFLRDHIATRERAYQSGHEGEDALDLNEYATLISLCCKAAVAMGYMAPAGTYSSLLADDQGAHFLLPRFEFAVDTIALDKSAKAAERERKRLDSDILGLLAWMAADGTELDRHHTQEAMDPNHEAGLPILVPDVIMSAHETATFARNVLGEEFVDALKNLVVQLRRLR